ncbi:MAG: hypothetical protein AAFN77_13605 [Planctomycetota bacterium]
MNQPQHPHPAKARPVNAKQSPQPAHEGDEEGEDELDNGNRFLFFNVMPSWMVSFLTHIAVILILALLVLPAPQSKTITVDSGQEGPTAIDDVEMNLDSLQMETSDALESDEMNDMTAPELTEQMEFQLPEQEVFSDIGTVLSGEDAFAAAETLGDLTMANETSARSGEGKKQALLKNGGTQGSEDAVQLALRWIVDHQLEDGGWDLDHTIGPGNHRDSPNPGTRAGTRNGATALALLPLLGAGNTHITGQYKKQVRYGLEYLKSQAKQSRGAISFMDSGGEMYSHGLCAIVFNEAYAMTQDPDLRVYAQGSIWFTEQAQDRRGGGWRYKPNERGDTSAVGWQLMAVKSGKISGLEIRPQTYKRAAKFLDSVSDSTGAYYGYMDPPRAGSQPANARTAVGLLCRMYMGWDRNVPGLVDGMEAIADQGPSTGPTTNMYYNYYATQAIKHMYSGKDEWKTWNGKMREYLIRTQEKDGNAAGSWHFGRDHASVVGGRLYNTSMACMTLEVYYRFLPLYGDNAANDQFELIDE